MWRGLSAGLQLFCTVPLLDRTPEQHRAAGYHHDALREMLVSQATSEDSGFWDYGLLMFYDEFARAYMFMGAAALSDFGWTEKTAMLIADAVSFKPSRTLYDMCCNTWDSFTAFSTNFLVIGLSIWGLFFADFWLLEILKLVRAYFGV